MLAVEIRGAVGYLTIDRPDVRNALGPEVVAALAAGLDRIESDAAVRAVVLTGAGKVFSAGADLSSMRKQGSADAEDNRRNALEMGHLFHRIYDFPKPVVARVPGPPARRAGTPQRARLAPPAPASRCPTPRSCPTRTVR